MEDLNWWNGRRILIATDAWNQTNGVVTTLKNLVNQLTLMKCDVRILSHEQAKFKMQMPFYPEVTLGWIDKKTIEQYLYWADTVHISTPEGLVGRRVLKACDALAIPYTTGYHTKWPEFISARFPIPESLVYKYMRSLHKNSKAILVPTKTVKTELEEKQFSNVKVWTRGVDRTQFSPKFRDNLEHCGHPFMVCVSRVSKEKNLDAFCQLDWPERFTKVIVGDGPYRQELQDKYPEVIFAGEKKGLELAQFYACADVFVFPSRADTFGLVMIEAMASGTPVAAYPVTGPIDVIDEGLTGCMDHNLSIAVRKALQLDRNTVFEHSKKWSWADCAKQFLENLHPRY